MRRRGDHGLHIHLQGTRFVFGMGGARDGGSDKSEARKVTQFEVENVRGLPHHSTVCWTSS